MGLRVGLQQRPVKPPQLVHGTGSPLATCPFWASRPRFARRTALVAPSGRRAATSADPSTLAAPSWEWGVLLALLLGLWEVAAAASGRWYT